MKKKIIIGVIAVIIIALAGLGIWRVSSEKKAQEAKAKQEAELKLEKKKQAEAKKAAEKKAEAAKIETEKQEKEEQQQEDTPQEETEEIAQVPSVPASATGKVICIDPGHQRSGDSTPEPVGPGATETKARVTGGTSGTTTGLAEYELNLQVAFKLRDELVARGYQVILTRESHDVNISNSERAAVANNAGVHAFIRIHANGSTDPNVSGAMTICQTASNPYNGALYAQSKALSTAVLDGLVNATGARKQYVWETDTMSGVNWAAVPVTIVEMGYMTNPTEDTNMASETYQLAIAQGIANGVDVYFSQYP